jgi:hypothetical protein
MDKNANKKCRKYFCIGYFSDLETSQEQKNGLRRAG